ncbi:transcription factor domain-containing protein [Aspergillus stella-maris]|uniref:transcription factor domain-containing protein n=1 Tax=Aspergillus stella-maris TaxID=1810926 RepID=UPI003CCCE9C1
MRKRGHAQVLTGRALQPNHPHGTLFRNLSTWPFDLDTTESLLLENYIERFSQTYPTFSGPTNPFLTVFLPLSIQSRVVLDALLALSGVQSCSDGSFSMGDAMLKLRQKALRGCRQLLTNMNWTSEPEVLNTDAAIASTQDGFINLFASCILLLLHEKLAGEGPENWSPHLTFIARLCAQAGIQSSVSAGSTDRSSSRKDIFNFLLNLFFYNDLVRATSLHKPTLSNFYIQNVCPGSTQRQATPRLDRFAFPRLIARISASDATVTDTEIITCNGTLSWLPSFALVVPGKEEEQIPFNHRIFTMEPRVHRIEQIFRPSELTDQNLVSQLYRLAAMVYRRQRIRVDLVQEGLNSMVTFRPWSNNTLALWAVQLVQLIPEGSTYESTLIWPIGIVARQLTSHDGAERAYIESRLKALERHFQMKNFSCVREFLVGFWNMRDHGDESSISQIILLG